MKIDTGSWMLWVFDIGCKDGEQYCDGHNKYDSSESNDHEKIDTKFEIKYGKGGVLGNTVKDTMYLTSNIEIKKQLFGAVTKTTTARIGYDGIIGIILISTIAMSYVSSNNIYY